MGCEIGVREIMSNSTNHMTPDIPTSQTQKTYYIVKIVEALIAISGTVIVGVNLATQTPIEGSLIGIILVMLLVVITLSYFASERQYRNPWLDYSSFLLKKRRNIVSIKSRADAAVSEKFRDVVMRGYFNSVKHLIDDLTQFKILALSEGRNELSEEIQSQIDELRSIITSRN